MKRNLRLDLFLGCLGLLSASCTGRIDVGVNRRGTALPDDGRYIYAAFNNGSIHVYAIDNGHQEVAAFDTVPGVSDVRGACASSPTGMFYISHQTSNGGYVVAVDLYTNTVSWNRLYRPNVDRLSCTPDGQKLYVPCNEAFTDDCVIVLDAATGDEITRVHVSPRPHDSLNSLSGDHVYIETKSSAYIDVIDTATDEVVEEIGPFAGIGGPYTINGSQTRVYGNFFGVNGFQVGDITTGGVLDTATIAGQTTGVPGQLNQHGIGLRPDEAEVWVTDGIGGQPYVHVFDVTTSPPQQIQDVMLSYANPHWITFTINGDYAYPAGPKLSGRPTDVVDSGSYMRVGSIGPSEDLLEVDIEKGLIARVGNQYGVGRQP